MKLSISQTCLLWFLNSSFSFRLVFFCKSELDGISATVALRKSDRRAIKSLSSVLHLDNDDDEEDQEEDLLENYAVDLKDLC